MTSPVQVHNPAYVCECKLLEPGWRHSDPSWRATEAETRAFYALHPSRAVAGQSARSRRDDARNDRFRKAVRR